MLELRIKHLEDSMGEVKADLKELRKDISIMSTALARVDGMVSKMPGFGGIAMVVGIFVALSTAVTVAAQFFLGS